MAHTPLIRRKTLGIADWLHPERRQQSIFSFDVTDIAENSEARSPTDLANVLRESYIGHEYLAKLSERYGYEAVRDRLLGSRSGTRPIVKRGDFGEAVTTEYLKSVEGYCIPILKLRYKITANQTLPGTDCLGLRIADGALVEVAFVESKFRASPDTAVAVKAAKQLKHDADESYPEILIFVARQLKESSSPLADVFETYLFDRNVGLDTYVIMLLHENAIWNEGVLTNLEDEEVQLEPLHAYVARITALTELSDAAFSLIDVDVVDDDD